jgi:hypothetical protein
MLAAGPARDASFGAGVASLRLQKMHFVSSRQASGPWDLRPGERNPAQDPKYYKTGAIRVGKSVLIATRLCGILHWRQTAGLDRGVLASGPLLAVNRVNIFKG